MVICVSYIIAKFEDRMISSISYGTFSACVSFIVPFCFLREGRYEKNLQRMSYKCSGGGII